MVLEAKRSPSPLPKGGSVLEGEGGLGASAVLGLRALNSALDDPSPKLSLESSLN